ncbi:hypothetical protein [Microbacterium hydrocarbonoxydans]|uniref:hypothetical protein n=1 Tax=Microbacterium hydrocarbonoxydans TaxID=273678 RepID=UPI00203E60CE|nr:hypothetical protein [Microbacterium hydrocarbonoxydans]MCM3780653.1 hypothetical protein [Microbacterium hydrocarbonoxydans]
MIHFDVSDLCLHCTVMERTHDDAYSDDAYSVEPTDSNVAVEGRTAAAARDLSGAFSPSLSASTQWMLEEVGKLGSMFSVSESLKGVFGTALVPSYLFDPALEAAVSASHRASSLAGMQGLNSILGSVVTSSFLSEPTMKSSISKALEASALSTGLSKVVRGTSLFDPKNAGLVSMGFPTSLFSPIQSIINEQLTSLKGFTGVPVGLLGELGWISELTKGLHLGRPHLPSNWRGVDAEPDELEVDVRAILEEGIPLAWVPSARVIELLLAAPDASSRRRVISNNHKGILTSCERLASRLPHKRALLYGDMIRKAIHALRDGHVEAAQALATNVLDTLLSHHSRDALDAPLGVVTNVASYKKFRKQSWRLTLAVHPATTIMSGRYTLDDRPDGYRRNATAHAITRHQYNRINAVLAIMNATSVLTCFVRDTPAFD